MNTHEKYNKLKSYIKSMDKVAIAFSGGVDSVFLLKVCKDVLDDNALAITVKSPLMPQSEVTQAQKLANKIGVKHIIKSLAINQIPNIEHNPKNRCYYCKKKIFSLIIHTAKKKAIRYTLDGSNLDDLDDYRPGLKAIKELDILSPLKQSKLTKKEIRFLSKELSLDTWDKPSMSCLATRIPTNEIITHEKLSMIEKAEDYIRSLGINQLRVRHHRGTIARIEVAPSERKKLFNIAMIENINKELKSIGYKYVTMDLEGYVMGKNNK